MKVTGRLVIERVARVSAGLGTTVSVTLGFEGRSFDCGSKVGFLTANLAYALARDDLAPAIRAEIKALLG